MRVPRRWWVVLPALLLALGSVAPAAVEARGFGGGSRSFGRSGGFGGGFGSRRSTGIGGLFGRSTPSRPTFGGGFFNRSRTPSGLADRRGTNFSTPPPSARPGSLPSTMKTPSFGGRVARQGSRTTVYDGNRTITYDRGWGGVPVPMGSSPLPYYAFFFMPWLFHNPYHYGMGAPHVGVLGSLVSLLVLGLVVVVGVALVSRAFGSSGSRSSRRRARYS